MGKILDWERQGNVIRVFCGSNALKSWSGEGWNGKPYEEHAKRVDFKYIDTTVDAYVHYDWSVMEPSDDWHYFGHSPWSKQDMLERKVPCLLLVPRHDYHCDLSKSLDDLIREIDVDCIYLGDDVDAVVDSMGEIIHSEKKGWCGEACTTVQDSVF